MTHLSNTLQAVLFVLHTPLCASALPMSEDQCCCFLSCSRSKVWHTWCRKGSRRRLCCPWHAWCMARWATPMWLLRDQRVPPWLANSPMSSSSLSRRSTPLQVCTPSPTNRLRCTALHVPSTCSAQGCRLQTIPVPQKKLTLQGHHRYIGDCTLSTTTMSQLLQNRHSCRAIFQSLVA